MTHYDPLLPGFLKRYIRHASATQWFLPRKWRRKTIKILWWNMIFPYFSDFDNVFWVKSMSFQTQLGKIPLKRRVMPLWSQSCWPFAAHQLACLDDSYHHHSHWPPKVISTTTIYEMYIWIHWKKGSSECFVGQACPTCDSSPTWRYSWRCLKLRPPFHFETYPMTGYDSYEFHFNWVNYNISPTWIKAIWGWFPLLTMIIIYPDFKYKFDLQKTWQWNPPERNDDFIAGQI